MTAGGAWYTPASLDPANAIATSDWRERKSGTKLALSRSLFLFEERKKIVTAKKSSFFFPRLSLSFNSPPLSLGQKTTSVHFFANLFNGIVHKQKAFTKQAIYTRGRKGYKARTETNKQKKSKNKNKKSENSRQSDLFFLHHLVLLGTRIVTEIKVLVQERPHDLVHKPFEREPHVVPWRRPQQEGPRGRRRRRRQ